MMKKFILLLSIASFALAACTREPQASHTVTLPVDSGQCSKVFLDGSLHTYWNALDKVSIFYGGAPENICGTFQGKDGDATGLVSFESSATIPTTPTYALFPYSTSNSISGTVLTAEIPSAQTYKEGSYANGSAVLAAKTTDGQLSFRYVNAVIALTLRSSSSAEVNIRSIVLHSQNGEAIAGKVNINMGSDGTPQVSVIGAGSSAIVMTPAIVGDNICTIGAGKEKTFFFCVAPGTLYDGYYFDVELEGGEIRKVRSTKKADLSAGVMEKIENGISVTRKIVIDFDELSWTPALPTKATMTGESGVEHSFVNPEDGKTYNIVACATTGGYYASSVFLRFNSPGSWLKLPMISGMRLCEFGAMVRQSATKGFSVSSTTADKGDVVPNTNYPTDEMIYSFVGGDVHEAYITFTSTNTQLMRLELYFE